MAETVRDDVEIRVVVERKHEELARYVVVPSPVAERWGLEGTTTVEGRIGGTDLGRRSLKRWDEERWFIDLPDALCRAAGVETGDATRLVLRVASERLPSELSRLLETHPKARRAWDGLTPSRRRMLREHVLAGKRRATRERRARRGLLGSAAPPCHGVD